MKKIFLSLVCLALLCQPLPTRAEDVSDLEKMLLEAAGNETKMCAFLERVSREMDSQPDNAHLIGLRIAARMSLGDVFAAGPDVEALARLNPNAPSSQMFRCMYWERAGAEKKDSLACYARVAELFEQQGLAADDSDDYLLALTLAESPQMPAAKERFLARLSDSQRDAQRRELFTAFSRDKIVSQWDPATAHNPCAAHK